MVDLVKKVLSVDVHTAERIYKNELESLGLQLYNKKAQGCGNCLIEIYILLYKNGIKMAEEKAKQSERFAELKPGVVLRIPQMGITWTNNAPDFTDKAATEVLKKFPAFKSRFSKLPKVEAKKVKTDSPKIEAPKVDDKAE